MSLLSRHEYILGLSAERVSVLVCRRAIWPPAVVITDKRAQANPSASTGAIWQSALESTRHMLADLPSGTGIRVVLSNQFMRYKVLPAMPVLMPASEKQMVAQQCFRDTHGEQVDQWTVAINPLPHGESVLVCAMDTALYQALHALAADFRCRLLSVKPYLMAGFNLARKHLQAEHSCFVQLESGRATLALIEQGQWRNIATTMLRDEPESSLLSALQRELLLAEMPPGRLQVVMHAEQAFAPFSHARFADLAGTRGWRVEQVLSQLPKGYQPRQDYPFAMAVMGVL